MKKYRVTIIETKKMDVEIEAESQPEAERKIRQFFLTYSTECLLLKTVSSGRMTATEFQSDADTLSEF